MALFKCLHRGAVKLIAMDSNKNFLEKIVKKQLKLLITFSSNLEI